MDNIGPGSTTLASEVTCLDTLRETAQYAQHQKSTSNQVCGKLRIQEYSQQKQLLKELPFYNARNSALRNLLDYSAAPNTNLPRQRNL